MAHSDKNILITPNIGSTTADPKIVFSGADASTAAQNITLQVYPTNSGTLSFEGSAGQLFSITNSLSGTIYSVNDVSGIPSIEVLDTGLVKLAQYSGNVLLGTGTDNATDKLQVNGSIIGTVLKSSVATGTAPLTVASTTLVTNLNADYLDGNHASAFYLATNPNGYTTNTGTVTSVGGTGTVSGLTLSGTVTSSGNLTLGGTLSVTPSNFASQTANTVLAAPNGSAGVPTFRTIVAADIPTLNQNTTGSAATLTTARTLTIGSTGKTFNGSANVSWSLAEIGALSSSATTFAGDSTAKDDITTRTETGFYESSTGTLAEGWPTNSGGWHHLIASTHSNDSNYYSLQLSSTFFDQQLYFRATNGSGTTAWNTVIHNNNLLTAGNTTAGVLRYNGTTATAGQFDGGTTTPTGTTRLNYGGYFYPTFINLIGSGDTTTASSHYFVETGSDGFVRPKTLANVQSEVVTTAVLGSGTANSTTYLRGDRTWGTPSASAAAGAFWENDITLATNYTITTNKNAMTAGPITIANGVTITVPNGSTWTVV